MTESKFIEELKNLEININDKQLIQLNKYYELLKEWNEKINLTSIIEKDQVYLKHFYDSLTLSKVYDFNKNIKICDIGTGAGFPGIVLKIMFPNLKIVLVDALMKRINFLNLVIEELKLENIIAIHERMEDYAYKHEEEFDIITARAVSNLPTLLEISAKSLKQKGKMLFLKGDIKEELLLSNNAIRLLNLNIEKVEEFLLPIENSKRSIVVIEKVGKTPNNYPRKFSDIKKKPL